MGSCRDAACRVLSICRGCMKTGLQIRGLPSLINLVRLGKTGQAQSYQQINIKGRRGKPSLYGSVEVLPWSVLTKEYRSGAKKPMLKTGCFATLNMTSVDGVVITHNMTKEDNINCNTSHSERSEESRPTTPHWVVCCGSCRGADCRVLSI